MRLKYRQVIHMTLFYKNKRIFACSNPQGIDEGDLLSDERRREILGKLRHKRRTFIKYS
jgi:hypothetical protein